MRDLSSDVRGEFEEGVALSCFYEMARIRSISSILEPEVYSSNIGSCSQFTFNGKPCYRAYHTFIPSLKISQKSSVAPSIRCKIGYTEDSSLPSIRFLILSINAR